MESADIVPSGSLFQVSAVIGMSLIKIEWVAVTIGQM